MTDNTATVINQLRVVLDLTHTEIQVAETRIGQARTEAVRRELSQNAGNARERAGAVEEAVRSLGGLPDVVGPFLGRATAMVKAMAEQAQPFDGAGGGRPRWPGGIATHPDAGRDRDRDPVDQRPGNMVGARTRSRHRHRPGNPEPDRCASQPGRPRR